MNKIIGHHYTKCFSSWRREADSDTWRGSPFQAAAALWGKSRRVAARRTRGSSSTAAPAAVARVRRSDTALRGRNIACRALGAAVTCRARYTLTASRRAIISLTPGQPSAVRAGPIWSYLRRPETSRAAKCTTFCSRSRRELVAPPQTDEQYEGGGKRGLGQGL